MRNINYSSKKAICSICVILALWSIGTQAAISSPDPDNAALLYYQAFLHRPELYDDIFFHFNSVLHGAQPDEKVREYLNMIETRETLRITEAATEILDCSWGIMHSQGIFSSTLFKIGAQLRQIALLLELDARTLAFDGDYRAALDRCLSIRRIVPHIADEHDIGYLISMLRHWQAFDCIQHILSSMSVDRDTLTWLLGQISTVQGAPPSPGRAFEITLEDAIKSLSAHPEILERKREGLLDYIEDESVRQEIPSLTDAEFLGRVKELYNKFLSSVNRVIGSDIPYQQKHLQLKQLEDEFIYEDPMVIILMFYVPINVADYNDVYVRNIAIYNALRAAIEIYLVKAKTGQLPATLPDGLPKDPYSGQDFGYEITEEGFTFHSQGEDFQGYGGRLLEFKVQQ